MVSSWPLDGLRDRLYKHPTNIKTSFPLVYEIEITFKMNMLQRWRKWNVVLIFDNGDNVLCFHCCKSRSSDRFYEPKTLRTPFHVTSRDLQTCNLVELFWFNIITLLNWWIVFSYLNFKFNLKQWTSNIQGLRSRIYC